MQIVLLDQAESFLETLNPKELAKTIRTIELLETFGHELGMPHSRHLAGGLLELRIRGTRELRIFYCFHKHKVVLLHGCIKNTQKTPEKEITRARTAKDCLQ